MRHDKTLSDAVKWLKQKGIELYGINENPDQCTWTSSPKVHCDIFVDDRSLGCPLTNFEGHTVVDWGAIEQMLKQMKVIA